MLLFLKNIVIKGLYLLLFGLLLSSSLDEVADYVRTYRATPNPVRTASRTATSKARAG
jgi:hypothetical protein